MATKMNLSNLILEKITDAIKTIDQSEKELTIIHLTLVEENDQHDLNLEELSIILHENLNLLKKIREFRDLIGELKKRFSLP